MSKRNQVVLNDSPNDQPYNLQAFVEVVLFNCELKGIYTVTETDNEKDTSVLIVPTSPQSNKFDLDQFIDEANNLITSFTGADIDIEAVKSKLKQFFSPEDIELEIKQLFLYMVNKTTKGENPSPIGGEIQYAFNLVITNKSPDGDFSLFKVKRFGIAIYKTEFEFVIKRMDLQSVTDLIS